MRKAWIGAALAALIAPLAVVASLSSPASADADGKHRHDLDTYKRESWVEILGNQSIHNHMYCDAGDYALDGTWKVDAHDADLTAVKATVSRRDQPDFTQWHYELNNTSSARAQVKLFITCLEGVTGEREGHTHAIDVDAFPVTPAAFVIGAAGVDTTLSADCPANEIPVAPGFTITGGAARLTASYPTDEDTWHWSFRTESAAGSIAVQIYCVNRTSGPAVGAGYTGPAHTHEIDADLRPRVVEPGPFGRTDTVALGQWSEHKLFARPHDDGKVGAFEITPGDVSEVFFLGQEPQGNTWVYRFLNTEVGPASNTVSLAVWGFDKRTKKNS